MKLARLLLTFVFPPLTTAVFNPSPSNPVAPTPPSPPGTPGYQIDIAYSTQSGWEVSSGVASVAVAAANRWSRVISGDVTDATNSFPFPSATTDFGECETPTTVDDLWMCFGERDFGATSGTLAYATVYTVRTSNGIPILGLSTVNSRIFTDFGLNAQDVENIITHEMGHSIGIGTRWVDQGLATSNEPPCDYRQTTNAAAQFRILSGCPVGVNSLRLEQGIGAGSYCGHWQEDCYGIELMTPSINPSTTMPLSTITVGALEDLGYMVNYANAETYTTSNISVLCRCVRRLGEEAGDEGGTLEDSLTEGQIAAREAAVEFGKQILAGSSTDVGELGEGVAFGKFVSVIGYDEETGGAFSVIVRSD